MTSDAAIRQTHADLSPLFRRFLDEVAEQPVWHRPESFGHVDEIADHSEQLIQAWPTLIDRETHAGLEALNRQITALVKTVPHRVFGNDADALSRFYDLDPSHGRMVRGTLSSAAWVDRVFARSDFIHTERGFRCIEVNLSSNLGGWDCGLWGPRLLDFEPLQQFFTREGATVRLVDPTRSMLVYLLRQGLKRFRSAEVNIVLLRTEAEAFNEPLEIETNEIFQKMLAGLGGKVRGSFQGCLLEAVSVRDGHVYLGDKRVHVLLDSLVGFTSLEITSCWLRGTVDLYNGPLTPVLNDKRNLALAWELDSAGQLETEESRLLHEVVPWTHQIGGTQAVPGAAPALGRDELLRRRHDLVLKPYDGSGGIGVLVGRMTDEDTWSKALDKAEAEGRWLVQRFDPSRTMLYFNGQEALPHSVVWSLFDYGGSFIRMTPVELAEGVVNSLRGATLGPVFTVEPADT